jgi:hypothetical protein
VRDESRRLAVQLMCTATTVLFDSKQSHEDTVQLCTGGLALLRVTILSGHALQAASFLLRGCK